MPARLRFKHLAAAAALLLLARPMCAQLTLPEPPYEGDDRIENWKGKTVLAITPHPDDETFTSGGTLHKLVKNGNKVFVLIYTSDNAGSNDPKMTKERLAEIRKAEEEDSCAELGIPKENITWLGHDDGMLEYVDRRELTKQVAREIRRVRPDAVFSIDPGAPYMQWHKSDHHTGAQLTADAMRAAAWRLYFPELEDEGFKHWSVPVAFFYYSANPNYTVDIEDVIEVKARASAAHTSQFEDFVENYDASKAKAKKEELAKTLLKSRLIKRKNGRAVEEFRRSENHGG